METLSKVYTAVKAKWDAVTPTNKLLLVSAVAATALVALWLS